MRRTRLLPALALLLLAGCVAGAVAAQAPGGPASSPALSLADLAGTRAVREAKASPDGSLVAYVLGVPRTPWKSEDGPAWAELHVVGRDGVSRGFVTGEVNVSRVSWTPDGSAIAFLAKRKGDETTGLHTIPRDGGEARRRASFATDIEGYDLAPDGRGVVFLARGKKPEAVEAREKKGFNQEVFEEEWRPVKVRLAELDAAGEPRTLDLPGSASDVRYSPSGDRLAVALAPTPSVDDSYMERRVHVVSVADGRVVAKLEHEGKLGPIAWSPDGARIALVCAADRHDPSTSQLAVAPASGGRTRFLLPDLEGHPEALAWKDATTIVLLASRGVATEVLAVPVDGGQPSPLVAPGRTAWSGFDRAADGALVLVGHAASHPAEVFVAAPGAAAPKRLTDSNPWLADRRLGRQGVVAYRARDGLELQGLLVEPLDRPAGARVPLVVAVHGGPEAHVSDGWLTRYAEPGQVLAGKGFAVFYPNYRGSTGRGLAFSKTSQADPAGKEFDDIVDGVDHLVKAGLVDPARVGITGGSYGGYATAWGATFYSERFAAGVMFVGISDLDSKAGTTDIPVEDVDVHLMSKPWTRWDLNRQRSPLTWVEKARTPLLILHGTDDPRVHPTQSLMLYRYIKLRGGVPVRYVRYPGEGHGNRRAASQLDLSARLVQWFEHYLKGPGGAPPPAELDPRKVLGIEEGAKSREEDCTSP
jgi:dipeptidyl aminopeptidase/acylaminoacyl peptidase